MNSRYKYKFTVFTPTYNRAHTLHRVYESLKRQTYNDYEWIIIDDGSTDGTSDLVKEWKKSSSLTIRYFYQENKGKHFAHNRAVKEARGKLFVTLDSDDRCVPDALEKLMQEWINIPKEHRDQYSAVTVLCKTPDGKIEGDPFPEQKIDSNPSEIYYKYGVRGEKWGFQRVDVLQKFEFPDIAQGNYLPESIIWRSIGKKYLTRFINLPLRIYHTDNISITRGGPRSKNAKGLRVLHKFYLNKELPQWIYHAPLEFFRSAIHFSRFSLHEKENLLAQYKALKNWKGRFLWGVALPVSLGVYLRDKLET